MSERILFICCVLYFIYWYYNIQVTRKESNQYYTLTQNLLPLDEVRNGHQSECQFIDRRIAGPHFSMAVLALVMLIPATF